MKRLIILLTSFGAIICFVFYTVSGGFDVRTHKYDKFSDVKGGWLPVNADVLPPARRITLRNDLDSNEYFFKILFSEANFNKMESYLKLKGSKVSIIDCTRKYDIRCSIKKNMDQLDIYLIHVQSHEGHKTSYWTLDKKNFNVYLSNQSSPHKRLVTRD